MVKRIAVTIIGAGIGSLLGLLADAMGAGNKALIVGAIVGAIVPLVLAGKPGK
ncbi:MAG TPA: hypothetical protein VKX45_19740 [Bryobacteraceae bacterium]|jgi:uncharacterized membrane protein YeaQ/YmgE (transglycosylase-associated protein family)|nr:hypothetical protein [Bryobacteraceae bacterium]